MSDDFSPTTRNRLAVEGEELVLLSLSSGSLEMVSAADARNNTLTLRQAHKGTLWHRIASFFGFKTVSGFFYPVSKVWVPSGTYLILKDIPTSLQQRYGLEAEEGGIYLRPDTDGGTSGGILRFNNGALVPLQDLRSGQLVEVLSLAGTQPALYESETPNEVSDGAFEAHETQALMR